METPTAPSLHDPHIDSRKPIYHVMPQGGYSADPHGGLFYKGRYHLFYQARMATCQWNWGICWNHVVSKDLVHWERLPPALTPTPGGLDADGCFSGSIVLDPKTGTPIIFYTGARLRDNPAVAENGILPPPEEFDLRDAHFESQCCAVLADPEDDMLINWKKVPTPWMQYPHTNQLTAWRDPIIVNEQEHTQGNEYMMLVCSGYRGKGASTLIYRSTDLLEGWHFDGDLARWKDLGLGKCWECPILIKMRPLPYTHLSLPTLYGPESMSVPQSSSIDAKGGKVLTEALASTKLTAATNGHLVPKPTTNGHSNGNGNHMEGGVSIGAAISSAINGYGDAAAAALADAESSPPVDRAGLTLELPVFGSLGIDNCVDVGITATTMATIKSDGLGLPKEVVYAEHDDTVSPRETLLERLRSPRHSFSGDRPLSRHESFKGGAEGDEHPGCYPPDDKFRWLFCISPDACTYSIIYFVGTYTRSKFDLDTAKGPFKLDLGNVLYAPTCFDDPKGRHILWGYLKELRTMPPPPCMSDAFSYAGCTSVPRVLWLQGDQLFQAPLPEMVSLRTDVSWQDANLEVQPGAPVSLQKVAGVHLDIEVSLRAGTAKKTSILLRSWRTNNKGAVALTFDWETLKLEVVYDVLEKPRKYIKVYGMEPPTGMFRNASNSSLVSLASGWSNASAMSGIFDAAAAAHLAETTPQDPPVPAAAGLLADVQVGADGSSAELTGEGGSRTIGAMSRTGAGSSRAYYEDPEDDADLEPIDLYDLNPDVYPELRMKRKEAGGVLRTMIQGQTLDLRIFLDASSLEVFTGTGEVLSTRVYRGHPPADNRDAGIQIISNGGVTHIDRLAAYEVGNCWPNDEDVPLDHTHSQTA